MLDMIQLGNVFRDNLKNLMRKRGWTHQRLADEMEVSRPYVTGLINGVREPGLSTLEKVSEIFDITPSELLREKNSK